MKHALIALSLLITQSNLHASHINFITSAEVITPELSQNAIIRQEAGFEKDFLVLHCLIKKAAPKVIFEVGTCEGYGTLIMANASPSTSIISLDLPPHTAPFFLRPESIGWKCRKPYHQVFGDSMHYNYEQHFPIDAWFLDGAHDYEHVKHETIEAIKSGAKLIVYHDTDIDEVLQAIVDTLKDTAYKIYRVTDTRVSYATK